ncbi:MAG: polysaccharide pyruvyl transferase family protein [Phycisphaerales bacterium]
MRILVDSGCYDLCNMGDVAMLQVAVERLHKLWPMALIEVITNKPAILSQLCPKSYAIRGDGRHIWFYDRNILGKVYKILPDKFEEPIKMLEQLSRRFYPTFYSGLLQFKMKIKKKNTEAIDEFLNAFLNTDLLVISGAGDINDHFSNFAITVLELLEIAKRQGIPTAMFSQGIGPIENIRLYKKAKAVLPKVDLIAIRERETSFNLLKSFGVEEDKILITGDDAIEPAYRSKSSKIGNCIGVNLRIASYSQANDKHIETLGNVIQNCGLKYSCQIMPIPISFYENEADTKIIQRMTGNYYPQTNINCPQEIINKVSNCRLVITGSYHSAVFALSQGIPAITLYKTAYYKNKFSGLARQFGCGCELISLDDNHFAKKLKESIDCAWHLGNSLRPRLLKAALNQIESAQAAYQSLYNQIENQREKKKDLFSYSGLAEYRR